MPTRVRVRLKDAVQRRRVQVRAEVTKADILIGIHGSSPLNGWSWLLFEMPSGLGLKFGFLPPSSTCYNQVRPVLNSNTNWSWLLHRLPLPGKRNPTRQMLRADSLQKPRAAEGLRRLHLLSNTEGFPMTRSSHGNPFLGRETRKLPLITPPDPLHVCWCCKNAVTEKLVRKKTIKRVSYVFPAKSKFSLLLLT